MLKSCFDKDPGELQWLDPSLAFPVVVVLVVVVKADRGLHVRLPDEDSSSFGSSGSCFDAGRPAVSGFST